MVFAIFGHQPATTPPMAGPQAQTLQADPSRRAASPGWVEASPAVGARRKHLGIQNEKPKQVDQKHGIAIGST